MRILAFPGRFHPRAKAPVRDWSTQEIADFYRAHRLLAENGAGIGIDRGVSDEGEPWMAFFDTVSHDVFLHIARIDDYCHLICDSFGLKLNAADIPSLIAQFEHAVRDQLAIRSDRAKNVVVHPAARIIMSISVVFLLFKLENGEAHAKGLSDKTAALGADARATEKSVSALARAQSAFARAFDAVDAPVNAALLAGLILAGELVLKADDGSADAEVEKLLALALAEHEIAVAKVDGVTLEAVVSEAIVHSPQTLVVETPAMDLVAVSAPDLPDISALVQFTPPVNVVQLASLGNAADFRAAQFVPVAVEASDKSSKVATGDVVAADNQSDAAKVLELLFAFAQMPPRQTAGPGEASPAPAKLGVVTLANLDDVGGKLAFSEHIDLNLMEMVSVINYLQKAMPGFHFGFDGKRTLITQADLADADLTQVALVNSTMGDGNHYSIIGLASILDDVVSMFG
ncbi:hypothetical protein [Devosia sp. SD17-2]|uniref:hypothetical protein n=1 Tax=Devosia sp. SD17-2 TaxID=2976459 RepID=UPI0023D8A3BC|nr:hypothetical protein [Devosia sp. SD17-2]WEJ32925.1 hypothetical protein NYQ88_18935 [Devosia sp. SD17-2]